MIQIAADFHGYHGGCHSGEVDHGNVIKDDYSRTYMLRFQRHIREFLTPEIPAAETVDNLKAIL